MNRGFSKTLNLLCASVAEWHRESGELNVSQAAKAMRINQPTLKRMLEGDSYQPRPHNLKKIERYFNITMDQVMGRAPIPLIDPVPSERTSDRLQAEVDAVTDPQVREDLADYIVFLNRKRAQQSQE